MSSRRYLGFGTSKKILGKQPDTNKLNENEENITPPLQIDESKSIKTEIQQQCATTPVNINKSIYYEDSPSPSPDDSDSSSASPQFLTLTQRLGIEVTWRSPKKNDKKNNEIQDTPKLIPSIRKRFVKKIRKQKQAKEQQPQQQKSGIYKFEEEYKQLLLSNQQQAGYDNNNNNNNNNNDSDDNINNLDINNNDSSDNNINAEHQCNSDIEYKSIHSIRQLSGKRNGKNLFDGNDSFMVKCSQDMEKIYSNTKDNKLGNINSSDMVPKINAGKDNNNIVNNNKLNNCFDESSCGKEINKSKSFFTDLKSENNNNNDNTESLNNSNLKNILFDDNDSFILQCSQEFDKLLNNNNNNDVNNNNNNSVSNNNSPSSSNHKTNSVKLSDEKPPNLFNRKSITPLKTPLKKSFSFKIKRETIYERHAEVLNKSMHENDNDDLLLGSIPIDQLLHDDEPRITKMKRYNSMPSPSSNLQNISTLSSSMPQNNKKGLAKINSFNNSSLDNSKESCSSRCTAEEINEKRRIAINRLKTRNNTFSRYKLKT